MNARARHESPTETVPAWIIDDLPHVVVDDARVPLPLERTPTLPFDRPANEEGADEAPSRVIVIPL